MKMDAECNADGSLSALDRLTTLNIVPFLGLMNLIEVKYLHMPEVYRTMLAILCDYNPLSQDNIVKTRRYLSVLLSREPDLAQCLLNFIDTPLECTETATDFSTTGGNVPDSTKHQNVSQGFNITSSVFKADNHVSEATFLTNNCVREEGKADLCLSQEDIKSSVSNNTLKTSYSLSTASRQTDLPLNNSHAIVPKEVSSQLYGGNSSVMTQNNETCSDRTGLPNNGPIINIHHREVVSSESAFASTSATTQQTPSLLLPHFLTSHLTGGVPAGLGKSGEPTFTDEVMASDKQRRGLLVGTEQTFNSQAQEKMHLTTPSICDMDQPNLKKSNIQCKVAQTQTSSKDTKRSKSPYSNSMEKEISNPFRVARTASTLPESSAEMLKTMATGQTSMMNPAVCLSKLLGQPSVTYLPAGHYIDNRNYIVGSSKAASANKSPQTTTVFSSRANQAAAKLRFLSTQARTEKMESLQSDCAKTCSAVTSKLESLSAKVPPSDRHSSRPKAHTTVKYSTTSAGCSKLVALSKVLPILKSDVTSSAPEQLNSKMVSVSSDKQTQAGGQRKVFTLTNATTDQTQANQTRDKQGNPVLKRLSYKKLSVYQQAKKAPRVSESKESHELQQNSDKECKGLLVRHIESKKSSMTLQKFDKIKSVLRQENSENIEPKPKEIQKSQTNQYQDKKTGNFASNTPIQKSQKLHETQTQKCAGQNSAQSLELTLCTADFANKHAQQTTRKMHDIKPAEKNQMKVIEVSVGTAPSLSAFPYIQQMVLPDGRVSTIAHNSPFTNTESTLQQTPTANIQMKDCTHGAYHTKQPNDAGGFCIGHKAQAPFPKETSQAIIQQNQIKLSVSIQTPSVQPGKASLKEQVQNSFSLSNPSNLKTYSLKPNINVKTNSKSNTENRLRDDEMPIESAHTKDSPDRAWLKNPHTKGKRKRSPHSSMKAVDCKHTRL